MQRGEAQITEYDAASAVTTNFTLQRHGRGVSLATTSRQRKVDQLLESYNFIGHSGATKLRATHGYPAIWVYDHNATRSLGVAMELFLIGTC